MKSLKTDMKQGNIKGIAGAYNNLGTCYFHQHNYDSSLICHLEGLRYSQKMHDKKSISHAQNNIAEIFMARNEFGKADSCLTLALALKREIGDTQGETIIWLDFGSIKFDQGNMLEAKACFENSFMLAKRTGSVKHLREASLGLYQVCEMLGNKEESFRQFKNYQLYKDSLAGELANNNLFNLELGHETEKKQKEITVLGKQKSMERKQKMMYAIAALFIIITALVLVGRQRIKIKKEKLLRLGQQERNLIKQKALRQELEIRERELAYNKNELMKYTRQLLEKNRLIEEIAVNLEELDLDVNELKEKSRIDKIEKLTEARIVTEEDWTNFKKLFEKVFPGFFVKLKDMYQGITAAEIRLAALLKLKLSSREIATMTGVSAESVKKTRQRIRKKMGMAEIEDLEDVISKI
jgi:tetratricopeptide (TPR) repeat protein